MIARVLLVATARGGSAATSLRAAVPQQQLLAVRSVHKGVDGAPPMRFISIPVR